LLYSARSVAAGESELLHPEVLRLRKAVLDSLQTALVSIFAALVCLSGWGARVWGQEGGGVGRVQSYGFSTSYSKTSSHILIGEADQRRIWTLGVEYTHLLYQGSRFRLDYEGSLMPLFEETDPTITGTFYTFNGQTNLKLSTPQRVLSVPRGPVANIPLSGDFTLTPIYGIFGRQDSYAAAFSPLGARISALPRWRVQPSMALDLGFVISASDIPVDDADRFNYLFSFGPGVQIFTSPEASVRVEYLYRHTSNAGQGFQNPGVDQGVFRLTLSRRW
jgi:hypothetical protein